MVYISARDRTFSLHHPVTTAPTLSPLCYLYCCETSHEILLIISNRYCRRNARFPVHSRPHRKFQKCAARVLIHLGLTGVMTDFYVILMMRMMDQQWSTQNIICECFTHLRYNKTLVGQQSRPTLDLLCKNYLNVGLSFGSSHIEIFVTL